MSHALINRSPDLLRLQNDGYELEVRSDYLLVHGIPYVNAHGAICRGTLISDLTLSADVTTRPHQHIVWFAGDHPCQRDGREIPQIKHASRHVLLAPDVVAQHSFSAKPADGYRDYYAKMTRYVDIISAAAQSIQPGISARTYKLIESKDQANIFRYVDTASSRAGISSISAKLVPYRVAIVGLGGTGSYLLDFLSKTPVREIHLFDGDLFLQHNAFRAPGAASLDELIAQMPKTTYLAQNYGKMRRGIVDHPVLIDETNVKELLPFDFVFLSMDSGLAKALIIRTLQAGSRPFIDVGMGCHVVEETTALLAILRVTTSTTTKNNHVAARVSIASPTEDDQYRSNIGGGGKLDGQDR